MRLLRRRRARIRRGVFRHMNRRTLLAHPTARWTNGFSIMVRNQNRILIWWKLRPLLRNGFVRLTRRRAWVDGLWTRRDNRSVGRMRDWDGSSIFERLHGRRRVKIIQLLVRLQRLHRRTRVEFAVHLMIEMNRWCRRARGWMRNPGRVSAGWLHAMGLILRMSLNLILGVGLLVVLILGSATIRLRIMRGIAHRLPRTARLISRIIVTVSIGRIRVRMRQHRMFDRDRPLDLMAELHGLLCMKGVSSRLRDDFRARAAVVNAIVHYRDIGDVGRLMDDGGVVHHHVRTMDVLIEMVFMHEDEIAVRRLHISKIVPLVEPSTGRQRSPTHITAAAAPRNPRGCPTSARNPNPSIPVIQIPPAIVIGCPAPRLIALPIPTPVGFYPIAIAIGTPVGRHAARPPAAAVRSHDDPIAIGLKRFVEIVDRLHFHFALVRNGRTVILVVILRIRRSRRVRSRRDISRFRRQGAAVIGGWRGRCGLVGINHSRRRWTIVIGSGAPRQRQKTNGSTQRQIEFHWWYPPLDLENSRRYFAMTIFLFDADSASNRAKKVISGTRRFC